MNFLAVFLCAIQIFSFCESPTSEQAIIDKCENLHIEETARCLTDEVKKFYKYRITEGYDKLTFEELRDKGGSCKDWSQFYVAVGEKLGFYSSYTIFWTNSQTRHEVAIVSGENKYCLMEQRKYSCFGVN